MVRPLHMLALASLGIAAACATVPRMGDPAFTVVASAETEPVGTANEDAADDPAIWHNAADPAASLIVATDKKAGLYVYALDGSVRHFAPGGLLNNVDLVDLGERGIVVVASDRNDAASAKLRVYRLDPASGVLTLLGEAPGGVGEAYGLCLHETNGDLLAYSVLKHGTVEEYRLNLADPALSTPLRTLPIASQAEGCVVDPRDGTLYVGEENRGIWRFAPFAQEGVLVARTDGRQLVADVEGLAIAPEGEDGGWLLASSQGDNAYTLYRLPGAHYAGRFRIGADTYGSTEETDGIALSLKDFGPTYPGGLLVVQDGMNAPAAQNFKLVSWRAVMEAFETWSQP